MNTLKAKITVFFFLTTLLIFSALALLILKMEREDRIRDLTGLLHHVSSEIATDHLDLAHPDADLTYLKRIELIRTLTADNALSNPFFIVAARGSLPRIPPASVSVETELSNGQTLIVGSDLRIIDKSIGRLAVTLYLLFLGALSLLSLIFYAVLQRLLEPMEQLARSCTEIDLEAPPKRFPLSDASVEILRVGSALQSLVDRIAFLREKERQMFKETAHQFKTPLAILKARLDRYALDPSADKEQFLLAANRDIGKLLKYLKELLIVHESQVSGDEPRTDLDVAGLIRDLSAYAAPLLQRKHQSIFLASAEGFLLSTHVESFKKLILTVLENCINHAPADTAITITLHPDERRIVFGNRIADEPAPALFNSNLGLNIIRELSQSLDIGVTVEHADDSFFLSLHCTRT